MKKHSISSSVIFIIVLIVLVIIVGIKVRGKRSVNLELIIITESKMNIEEVKEIIIDSLKTSDPKIKVNVRESSDEVVTLENNFVGTLNTTLNKDQVIKILSKYKGFKHVQPSYIFKAKS